MLEVCVKIEEVFVVKKSRKDSIKIMEKIPEKFIKEI